MSAGRVLQIIDFVANRNSPVGVSEVCGHLKLPQATVYRMFTMLESRGILQHICNSNKVELSDKFLQTIINGASNDQLISGFRGYLNNIADATNATAFVSRLSGKLVKLFHVATPTDSAIAYIHPGLNTRPAHACSASRAILAYLDEEEINQVLGSNNITFTEKTLVSKDDVLKELRATKERGYAVCDEEIDVGLTSIAVPAMLGRAGVVCSVGIVGVSSYMRELGLSAAADLIKGQVKNAVAGFNNSIVSDPIGSEVGG